MEHRLFLTNLKIFSKNNGINLITTPVGNPATNGQAENAIKTVKNALKRSLCDTPLSEFNNVLCRFLLDYRNTIHISTGVSPAFLMFNKRKLRTRLDLLNPKRNVHYKNDEEIKRKCKIMQSNQQQYYKGNRKTIFSINENVMVKDYSVPGKVSWLKSTIFKPLGKQTYLVKTTNNKIWKRHANQIFSCQTQNDQPVPCILQDPLQKICIGVEEIETSEVRTMFYQKRQLPPDII